MSITDFSVADLDRAEIRVARNPVQEAGMVVADAILLPGRHVITLVADTATRLWRAPKHKPLEKIDLFVNPSAPHAIRGDDIDDVRLQVGDDSYRAGSRLVFSTELQHRLGIAVV